jgi:RNA polymerase sigma-70 factor (ECF subfamily)
MSSPTTVSPSLLARLRVRDPDAWQRMTTVYAPLLYHGCRRAGLRPDDSADIVQEVFQAVAMGLAGFRRDRPGDSFGGWLRGILQNKINDHWRDRGSQSQGEGGTTAHLRLLQAPAEDDRSAIGSDIGEEFGSIFRHALERVRAEFEPKTWRAFWDVTVEGRSPGDVAAALGMSTPAVYMAKSRVLRRVREEFAGLIE